MTQEEFDNIVVSIATRGVDYAETTCDFRRRSDPDSLRRETEYIMLRNIIYSLQNYDITSEILEDEELSYLIELAEQVLTVCPDQGILANEWLSEPVVPSDILFVVDNACTITIGLAGSGTVDIDWGDGVIETETLRPYSEEFYQVLWEFSHTFSGASIVRIISATNVTAIAIQNSNVSVIEISENLVELHHILIDANISEFITHVEWANMDYFTVEGTGFTNINVYAEWVDLRILFISSPELTSLTTHKEWVKLIYFSVYKCSSLTSVETHKEWVLLQYLGLYYSGLTSIITHKEWIKMITISARYTILTTIQLHPEWTLFETFIAYNSNLSTLTLYPQLTQLRTIDLSYSPVTSIVLFNTMVNDKIYDVNFVNCNITDVNVINNILIVLDSVITSNIPSKTIRLQGGTNAAPTGAGLTAKNNIIAKGCTVQTN